MPEHSPLPWYADEDGDVRDASNKLVLIIASEERARVPLILLAVNHHAELVAFVRELGETAFAIPPWVRDGANTILKKLEQP